MLMMESSDRHLIDKVRSLKLLTYNTKYLESDTEYWQKKT